MVSSPRGSAGERIGGPAGVALGSPSHLGGGELILSSAAPLPPFHPELWPPWPFPSGAQARLSPEPPLADCAWGTPVCQLQHLGARVRVSAAAPAHPHWAGGRESPDGALGGWCRAGRGAAGGCAWVTAEQPQRPTPAGLLGAKPRPRSRCSSCSAASVSFVSPSFLVIGRASGGSGCRLPIAPPPPPLSSPSSPPPLLPPPPPPHFGKSLSPSGPTVLPSLSLPVPCFSDRSPGGLLNLEPAPVTMTQSNNRPKKKEPRLPCSEG